MQKCKNKIWPREYKLVISIPSNIEEPTKFISDILKAEICVEIKELPVSAYNVCAGSVHSIKTTEFRIQVDSRSCLKELRERIEDAPFKCRNVRIDYVEVKTAVSF